MLKKIVLGNFAKGPVDPEMAGAIDFMVDRVRTLRLFGLRWSSMKVMRILCAVAGEPKPERAGIQVNAKLPELLRGATQNQGCCCDSY